MSLNGILQFSLMQKNLLSKLSKTMLQETLVKGEFTSREKKEKN